MDWGSLTEDQLDRIIAQSEQEIAGWRVVEMAAIREKRARQSHDADGWVVLPRAAHPDIVSKSTAANPGCTVAPPMPTAW
ncbi:MAG: hypothetical protein M3P87_01925 [Actinomycetota bacterium]|nr:hypothetical protein [Actinomycetota bacterium]